MISEIHPSYKHLGYNLFHRYLSDAYYMSIIALNALQMLTHSILTPFLQMRKLRTERAVSVRAGMWIQAGWLQSPAPKCPPTLIPTC